MERLTEEESAILRNALDTYVTIGLAQSHEAHAVRKKLQEKINGRGFLLFSDEPRVTAEEAAELKEMLALTDEHEVDNELLLSVGEDGIWVNTWDFVGKIDIPKKLFARLYPGETHPEDEENEPRDQQRK